LEAQTVPIEEPDPSRLNAGGSAEKLREELGQAQQEYMAALREYISALDQAGVGVRDKRKRIEEFFRLNRELADWIKATGVLIVETEMNERAVRATDSKRRILSHLSNMESADDSSTAGRYFRLVEEIRKSGVTDEKFAQLIAIKATISPVQPQRTAPAQAGYLTPQPGFEKLFAERQALVVSLQGAPSEERAKILANLRAVNAGIRELQLDQQSPKEIDQ
jgi:hypothetical protein